MLVAALVLLVVLKSVMMTRLKKNWNSHFGVRLVLDGWERKEEDQRCRVKRISNRTLFSTKTGNVCALPPCVPSHLKTTENPEIRISGVVVVVGTGPSLCFAAANSISVQSVERLVSRADGRSLALILDYLLMTLKKRLMIRYRYSESSQSNDTLTVVANRPCEWGF
ncbi:hypothetical protein P167DRAFT_248322 [Morchella conica CCBAS932]|uniref:Uncharacterized protein n=1 Tax=Morchella conica CCBAS932 TaxID=1392247 RepID=A0A3N4KJ22_9PEZI|nr:hypothetical protein P167DRAFT_248322 [Morchella conica CCBAS932]